MANAKLENLLNLALSATTEELENRANPHMHQGRADFSGSAGNASGRGTDIGIASEHSGICAV